MDISSYLKSVLEQDRAAVVLCNLHHEIVYMNPVAVNKYEKYGGAILLGKSLLNCHAPSSRDRIQQVVDWFSENPKHNIVFTYHNEKENKDVYMVALRDDNGALIGYYEKHEYRNAEISKPYTMDS